jgi:hypothetical protein
LRWIRCREAVFFGLVIADEATAASCLRVFFRSSEGKRSESPSEKTTRQSEKSHFSLGNRFFLQ